MIKLENINYGDKIAIALSGGMDSMCLLDVLLKNKAQLNLSLIAINIEHGIRGEDSVNDSKFVKDYCLKKGVDLYFRQVDVPLFCNENGYSIEQGARILRYGVFEEFLKDNNDYKIATAHHSLDNVESVLLNIFRGTGIKGLKGIVSTDKIIRPLIKTSKKDIENYVKENDIPYVVDVSNFDEYYARNYLRNNVIPLIIDKFQGVENNVLRLSMTATEEDEFLDQLSLSYIEKISDERYAISLNLNNVIIKRASILILKNLNVKKDYEKIHLTNILSLKNLQTGSEIVLPKNVVAVREYDKIVFYKKTQKQNYEYPFSVGNFNFENCIAVIKEAKKDDLIYFDKDKIPTNAVIRTRKDGDIFKSFGGGTKKLNDYFIDKKVPKLNRDNTPLIADGNNVLVIFDLAISQSVKVDENTTSVLSAKIIKE